MQTRARSLTIGKTNDVQKARSIFDAFVSDRSGGLPLLRKPATAAEAFSNWDTGRCRLGCQESSFVYVALARAVGLKAYHTFVDRDSAGMWLLHGCSAVFIGTKPLIVDTAYEEFDARHQRFTVLSDLEAAGLYLSSDTDLRKLRMASRLSPRLAIVRASLIEALAEGNQWDEVNRELEALQTQEPQSPLTYACRARVAIHSRDARLAVDLLKESVQLAPRTEQFHFLLGTAYAVQGQWTEARKCYENATRFANYEKSREAAVGASAFAYGAERQAVGDWDGAITNYASAIKLAPERVDLYLYRASAEQMKGDY
jgi:tetratricopeptide (TPR) repeat protein